MVCVCVRATVCVATMLHVVIIGNISAGKTTLLALLRKYFDKDPAGTVVFCEEPVDEWQSCGPDKRNALQEFYADIPKNATAFQIIAFSSRIRAFYQKLNALAPRRPSIVISERSIDTDRIFAHATIAEGSLEALAYDEIHAAVDAISNKHREHMIVYLRTPPEECFNRAHNVRKRAEESDKSTVSLEYLQKLHAAHDDYYAKAKCECKLSFDNSKEKVDIEALVGKIRAKAAPAAK